MDAIAKLAETLASRMQSHVEKTEKKYAEYGTITQDLDLIVDSLQGIIIPKSEFMTDKYLKLNIQAGDRVLVTWADGDKPTIVSVVIPDNVPGQPAGGTGGTWGTITGSISNQTDLQAALNGKAAASHVHDYSAVYAAINHSHTGVYSVVGHNHNDLYYTESEVDTLLSGKSAVGHTHSHSDTTSKQGGTTDEYYHLTHVQHTIATTAASAVNHGYLSSTDWGTFNGKQEALTPGNSISINGATIDTVQDLRQSATPTFAGVIAGTIRPETNGTSAVRIQNATGSKTYAVFDSVNNLIGLHGQPSATSKVGLDIWASLILIGADNDGTYIGNRSSNQDRIAIIACQNRATTGNVTSFYQFNSASANTVALGGGYANYYAATTLSFYTSAGMTDTTGINRLSITKNGYFGYGTINPVSKLHILETNYKATANDGYAAGMTLAPTYAPGALGVCSVSAGVREFNATPTAGGSNYSVNDILTVTTGGTGAQCKVTVIDNVVGAVSSISGTPTAGGTGYTVGDVLTITTGGTGCTVTVSAVNASGVVTSISTTIVAEGAGYTTGAGKATSGGTGTGCTVNITAVRTGLTNGVVKLQTYPIACGVGYTTGTGKATSGGTGSGCTVRIMSVANGSIGSGYTLGDILTLVPSGAFAGSSGTVSVATINVGAVVAINSTPTAGGSGYTAGDVLTITTGGTGCTVTVATVDGSGAVTSLTTTPVTGGCSYTAGTGKATTGGTGSGCTVNITTVSGSVSAIDAAPTAGGTGYTVGDVLAITTGGTGCTVTVSAVDGSGTVTALNTTPVTGGTGYTAGTGKVTTGGTGSGCTVNITALTTTTGGVLTVTVATGGDGWQTLKAFAVTGGTGTGCEVYHVAGVSSTITRHNYLNILNVAYSGSAPSSVVTGCVFRFDTAAHCAIDGATGAFSGFIKHNLAGTIIYSPYLVDKTVFPGDINIASGKVYKVNGTQVLAAQQTGIGASLTSRTAGGTYGGTEQTILQEAHDKVRLIEAALKVHGMIAT